MHFALADIRKYLTLTGRTVDVIRSRRETPLTPLMQFWTSLLVNFVAPNGCGSAYPRMMFKGKGYVKEFGMTVRDTTAMRKYTARPFREDEGFSFVPELWGTWKDPAYWVRDYFSDREAMVVDFRVKYRDPVPSLPVQPLLDGWKLVVPFPIGAHSLLPFCSLNS